MSIVSRKVIQICSTPETFESQFTIFALCDDGAIFQSISGGEWQEIQSIPKKHTLEEDFDHFLSCSGFRNESQEIIDKLKKAFEAAW